LIATPNLYDGKRISTDGIITVGFEANALHLSTEAATKPSFRNSIQIMMTDFRDYTHLHMKWVYVVGTFHKRDMYTMHPGYIIDIEEIYDPNDVVIEELPN
jgi:hypothetical protein